MIDLRLGDCLEVLPTLAENSVDSIVTDPPYGLSFMGRDWDHGVPGVAFWEAALRVAKPGAHLLAFGGTRTFHRLACAIEDAGWEIRDTVMWVYGSGFPKGLDISKAIDKAAGAERPVVGTKRAGGNPGGGRMRECNLYDRGDGKTPDGRDYANARAYKDARRYQNIPCTAPATPEAARWDGWGTALKPAWEPVIVARKPLAGTVAANVLAWGCGGINIGACRVGTRGGTRAVNFGEIAGTMYGSGKGKPKNDIAQLASGRWPANVIHDGSDEVVKLFPANAERFFYCAKASKADRDEGCEGLPERDVSVGDRRPSGSMSQRIHADEGRPDTKAHNHHPTVKPTALMQYLVRLVTPSGGVVLDPFMGSGSTGKAAVLEGFSFIGIEREAEYLTIAQARIAHAQAKAPLLALQE